MRLRSSEPGHVFMEPPFLYAKLLHQKGHGHPLWIPEVEGGVPLPGDLCLLSKKLVRVFSVTHPANHPNQPSQTISPGGLELCELVDFGLHVKEDVLHGQPVLSYGVLPDEDTA